MYVRYIDKEPRKMSIVAYAENKLVLKGQLSNKT